jgi:hypothetical protein
VIAARMKNDIDDLIRKIEQALLSPPPTPRELAAVFRAMGTDGHSLAIRLRVIVRVRAEDTSLPAEVREHARMRLATLPSF